MQVFTLDFVPYAAELRGHLDHYPIGREHFDPEVAARSFAEEVEQFQLCEELGFDGVCVNEHHGSPYGLDNSPNLFLAHVAGITRRLKLAMLGNLLALRAHPLRVAEELAMLDVISRGRVIAGFVRGIAREFLVYGLPMRDGKARFDEALEVILGAWTSDLFSHHGRFFDYEDVDMWPRPYQQPHPPVWLGALSDDSTAEIARRPGVALATAFFPQEAVNRQLKVFREAAAEAGRVVTDADVVYGRHLFVAETEAEAVRLAEPHLEYFWHQLSAGITKAAMGKIMAQNPDVDWSKARPPFDASSATVENLRQRGLLLIGTPDQVFEQIMDQYEQTGGFGTLLAIMRTGPMPQEKVLRCVRLVGEELLPKLHAVTAAQGAAA